MCIRVCICVCVMCVCLCVRVCVGDDGVQRGSSEQHNREVEEMRQRLTQSEKEARKHGGWDGGGDREECSFSSRSVRNDCLRKKIGIG